MTLTLGHFLSLGAMLFALSVIGIFLNRKNLIVLLMAIELMLLAVNMNFVAFSHFLGDMHGQIFVFFILTVAARRVGHRAGTAGAAVPQQVEHQRRRTQLVKRMIPQSSRTSCRFANPLRGRCQQPGKAGSAAAAGLCACDVRPWSH